MSTSTVLDSVIGKLFSSLIYPFFQWSVWNSQWRRSPSACVLAGTLPPPCLLGSWWCPCQLKCTWESPESRISGQWLGRQIFTGVMSILYWLAIVGTQWARFVIHYSTGRVYVWCKCCCVRKTFDREAVQLFQTHWSQKNIYTWNISHIPRTVLGSV